MIRKPSSAADFSEFTHYPPVSTYSIVARDAETGEMGVAVQSHYFSVGSVVPWAEAGVGAVATQSNVDPAYGPLGLTLMRAGKSADQALSALLTGDSDNSGRQVAMIDMKGRVAAYTGEGSIPEAGHKTGEQYSVQANLMAQSTVPEAMANAFETAQGDLVERLLRALEAAEVEGGDIRGKQSAALLVVRAEPTGKAWLDRLFDLRVEDHANPLRELRRLVDLKRAYISVNEAITLLNNAEFEQAGQAIEQATTLVPDEATNGEIVFWLGVNMIDPEHEQQASAYLRRAYLQDKSWAEVLSRLFSSGRLSIDKPGFDQLFIDMQQGD